MAEYYKGQRISDLLRQIDELSRALENSYDDYENEALTERSMEARATLAIAKAKLTALQGE
jgi:hypothetical protein